MKKIVLAMAAVICCVAGNGIFSSCSKNGDENQEGSKMVKELTEWLNIDENGECAYICNDEGVYFVGADNLRVASSIARNLSLGASEKGSLTLPDDLGTISVTTPTDYNGIYFEINYNVKGISVKKLVIISNEVLENGDENLPYVRPSGHGARPTLNYICNDCPAGSNEFSTSGTATRCPKCGSLNIKLK